MSHEFFDETADLGDDKRVEVKTKLSQPFEDAQDSDIDSIEITVEAPDGSEPVSGETMEEAENTTGRYFYIFETERDSEEFPEGVYTFTVKGIEKRVEEYEIRKVRYR